jgi:hypothetical protein
VDITNDAAVGNPSSELNDWAVDMWCIFPLLPDSYYCFGSTGRGSVGGSFSPSFERVRCTYFPVLRKAIAFFEVQARASTQGGGVVR